MKRLFLCALVLAATLWCVHMARAGEADVDPDHVARVRAIQDMMLTTGDFSSASVKLAALDEKYPGTPEVLAALGESKYGMARYAEAFALFKEALDAGAERTLKDMVEHTIGEMEKNHEILDSIEIYMKTLGEVSPEERPAVVDRLNAAHAAMLKGLTEGESYYIFTVLPHLLWLRDNLPMEAGIRQILGDTYYSSRYYKEAANNYQVALKVSSNDPELCRKLADAYAGSGDFASARKYYDVLISIYEKNETADAPGLIKQIKSIKQALPESYKDIAGLIKNGQLLKAEEAARKRLSVSPGDYVALTQLGQVYWEKGDKRMAIKLFRDASRRAPDYPTAHLFLGKAYFFERKPDKGMKEFEVFSEKMALVPEMDEETKDTYVRNLHYICYMYYTQRKYDKAMEECRKILELNPDDQKAHYNLAVCYYVHGHSASKAYSELQKVIDIDPSTSEANSAKFYIDYIRRNPDARVEGDFNFIYEK